MKLPKLLLTGAAMAALLALGACNDDNEPKEEPGTEYDDAHWAALASISSSDANFTSTSDGGTVYFKASGGSVAVSVDCGCDWTAENSAADVFSTSLSATSLTITASQNTVEQELSGTITLKTATDLISFATISITQAAYGAPEITVETNEWNFAAKGELTAEIAVEASADWTAEAADAWLSVTTSDGSLTLTAAENEDTAERSTKVTLTCSDGINSAYEYINVSQDAKAYVTLTKEAVTFTGKGDEAAVSVESNYDWEYSYDTSNGWFSVTRDGDSLIITSTKDNDTDEDFEGTVTVTAGDGAENVAETVISVSQYGGEVMILEYNLTGAGTKVTLPLAGTVNCTVDWGDGSEAQTVTSTLPSHTYADAGEYNVVIDGTVTTLSSSDIASSSSPNTTFTGVRQWGKTGLTSLYRAFYYCSNFKDLPETTGDALADVTTFQSVFYYSISLESVPADLFKGSPDNTSLGWVFYGCSALQSIPEGLFAGCTKVTTIKSGFYQCTSLTEVPAGLFDDAVAATDMSYLFYGCSKLTTLHENLFSHCTSATTFEYAFYKCTALKAAPAGLFSGCSSVKTFQYLFYGCTAIESAGEGLFKGCSSDTTMYYSFYNCSSLASIPSDIFEGCSSIANFRSCFQSCSSMAGLPKGLLDDCVSAKNFQRMFYDCSNVTTLPEGLLDNCTQANDVTYFFRSTSITSIPEGLFDKCPKITSFSNTFWGCKYITEIPDKLFAAQKENVTSFQYTFYGCSLLKKIPDGFFKDYDKVEDFGLVFSYCSALTELPEDLFSGCTAVTSFQQSFAYCTELKEIPAKIFSPCPAVKSFQTVFSNCTALTSIPADLFGCQTEAENFWNAFKGCTGLTSIPENLFANCKKATDFRAAFNGCTALTGESAYDVIEVDGSQVKVHLYERSNYTDVYTAPSTMSTCYTNCTGLSDYYSIPSSWGGGGN